jgi:hypothetical protein
METAMARFPSGNIGTHDLEKGMRTSPAATFATIATIAIAILLIFDSADLENWTRHLPHSTISSWLTDRASGWHRLMQRLGPATLFDDVRRKFQDTAP